MLPEQESHTEPEIIPPGRPDRRAYRFVDAHGTRRVYAVKLGPFGIILLALVIAIIAATMFVLLLGAVLLWIPVFIMFVAAAAIFGLLRR